MKRLQSAMFDGIKATLEADAVFLNIPLDLYTVMVDWFDAFLDEDTQWKNLCEAYDKGAAEIEDLILFRFPNLTSEEIAEKIIRIKENQKVDTAQMVDLMFMGG